MHHKATISYFFSQIHHKQRPRACTSACAPTHKAYICAAEDSVCDHEVFFFSVSSNSCRLTCMKSCKRMWTGAKQGHSARFLGKLSALETQMKKVGGLYWGQNTMFSEWNTSRWKLAHNLNILKTTIHFLFIRTVIYTFSGETGVIKAMDIIQHVYFDSNLLDMKRPDRERLIIKAVFLTLLQAVPPVTHEHAKLSTVKPNCWHFFALLP